MPLVYARLPELPDSHEVKSLVLNTGPFAGGDDHPGSKKVTISYSSVIVPGLVEAPSKGTKDPRFRLQGGGRDLVKSLR
jgi:hypothetical protein